MKRFLGEPHAERLLQTVQGLHPRQRIQPDFVERTVQRDPAIQAGRQQPPHLGEYHVCNRSGRVFRRQADGHGLNFLLYAARIVSILLSSLDFLAWQVSRSEKAGCAAAIIRLFDTPALASAAKAMIRDTPYHAIPPGPLEHAATGRHAAPHLRVWAILPIVPGWLELPAKPPAAHSPAGAGTCRAGRRRRLCDAESLALPLPLWCGKISQGSSSDSFHRQ